MNKKFMSLILAGCFSLALVGCNNAGQTSNNETSSSSSSGQEITVVTPETYGSFWMRSHDYKTMPVAAFNALPPKLSDFTYSYIENEETYAAYAEARVNTMMGLYEYTADPTVDQALDWCYEYDLSYSSKIAGRNQQLRNEENYWKNHKLLSKAEKFAVDTVAEELQESKRELFAFLAEQVKKAEETEQMVKIELMADYH